MKKSIYILILILFSSCNNKKNVKAELNSTQLIREGEWISNSDSQSGISIREDKIAFFKNMEFNSDAIYKYKIVDSVEYENDRKKILSTYLVTYDNIDTISYKIESRKNSELILKLKDHEIETFKLKRK